MVNPNHTTNLGAASLKSDIHKSSLLGEDPDVCDAMMAFETGVGAFEAVSPHSELEKQRIQGDVHPVGNPRDDGHYYSYEILGWRAAGQVLKNADAFSSEVYNATIGWSMGHTILMMDAPMHTKFRNVYRKYFERSQLDKWASSIFEPLAHRLIDAFAEKGRTELIKSFAFELPSRGLAQIIGFPEEDQAFVHSRAIDLLGVGFNTDRALKASDTLATYFRSQLKERSLTPKDDLMSYLGQATIDGETAPEHNTLSFLRLLTAAGAETTFRSLCNLLFALITHPEALEEVRQDRSLVPKAVEESLRWETADFAVRRLCKKETLVGGVLIPEGALLSINLLSINRDERIYEDPHTFNIHRQQGLNMAFAAGPHYCLGAALARLELSIALNALLDRIPDFRADPTWDDPQIRGHHFRRPRTLPIVFTPEGEAKHVV